MFIGYNVKSVVVKNPVHLSYQRFGKVDCRAGRQVEVEQWGPVDGVELKVHMEY